MCFTWTLFRFFPAAASATASVVVRYRHSRRVQLYMCVQCSLFDMNIEQKQGKKKCARNLICNNSYDLCLRCCSFFFFLFVRFIAWNMNSMKWYARYAKRIGSNISYRSYELIKKKVNKPNRSEFRVFDFDMRMKIYLFVNVCAGRYVTVQINCFVRSNAIQIEKKNRHSIELLSSSSSFSGGICVCVRLFL